MTIGKTITLTRWTFVGKVMSLLFNKLSRLVITFLPSSKRLLISWLQSPSAVILEPPKTKSFTVSKLIKVSYSQDTGLQFHVSYPPGLIYSDNDLVFRKKKKNVHHLFSFKVTILISGCLTRKSHTYFSLKSVSVLLSQPC